MASTSHDVQVPHFSHSHSVDAYEVQEPYVLPFDRVQSTSIDAQVILEPDVSPIEMVDSSFRTPEKGDEIKTVSKPYKGKIFESLDVAKKFYIEYGCDQGFPTRVNSTSRRRQSDSEVSCCVLVCGHQGFPKKQWSKQADDPEKSTVRRQTSSMKCGCKAQMRLVRNDKGNWVVTLFEEEHNHNFMTSSHKGILVKVNRSTPEVAHCLSVTFDDKNLPIGKVCSVLGEETIGFIERDYYSHLNSLKKYKTPKDGDATTAFNYFKKKNAEDPHFFYNIQTDVDGRAINFFWVDGRSRLQYSHFGDVICFDSTSRKNVYSMPFGPFTGLNHHFQTIQFGCVLLLDETEESFIWLFQTWLTAMGGRAPISIITDQHLAMTSAISKVFPNTRHRFCFWHIENKFSEYFSYIYHKRPEFAKEVRMCLWSTFRECDFDAQWNKLLVAYGLEDHPWLQSLYEIREKWVPAYNYNTFYAGMNTAGRREGMNSFCKDYFTHATTLGEFLVKYDQCVDKISKKEKDEDYRTRHFYRILRRGLFLQKHARKLYTRSAFEKFEVEFNKAKCDYKVLSETPGVEHKIYVIRSREIGDRIEWIVNFNLTTLEGSCECKYFQFMGIPCGHLLKIFLRHDIDDIPTCFVLRRWKQRANQYNVDDGIDLLSCAKGSKLQRILHGSQLANQVVCEAAVDDERFKMLVDALIGLSEKFAEVKVTRESQESTMESTNVVNEEASADTMCTLLKVSQTKGRPKGKPNDKASRIKRGIEVSEEDGGRLCTGCGLKVRGHDKRNCPNPKVIIPQQSKRPRRGKSLVLNDEEMEKFVKDEDIENLD